MGRIKEFAIDNVNKLKRFLAGLTVFALLTPVGAKCESNEEKDTTPKVSQEEQIKEEDRELDVFTFTEELETVERYLNDRLEYPFDIMYYASPYYTTNIDFIEDERPFIELGYALSGENSEDGNINVDATNYILRYVKEHNKKMIQRLYDLYYLQGYAFNKYDKEKLRKYLKKFVNSSDYSFEMAIAEYNVENPYKAVDVIHKYGCIYDDFLRECLAEALEDENFDIEVFMKEYFEKAKVDIKGKLIYPSVFCHSNRDKEILDQTFEKAFQVLLYYVLNMDQVKNLRDIPGYSTICEQLISSGSGDGVSNINEASTGAVSIGKKIIGALFDELQHHYTFNHYDTGILEKYCDVYKLIEDDRWEYTVIITDPCNDLEQIIFGNQQINEVITEGADVKLLEVLHTKFSEKTIGNQ